MPKGFTDKEKELIKQSLLAKGKQLFNSYGLNKTSIKDITESVHISQGSFYSFYNSKEELYFDILQNEEAKIREELMSEIDDSQDALKNLLMKFFFIIENNPLIRQLITNNDMESILRKLSDEKIESHLHKDSADLLPLILRWQEKGILRNEEPEVIISLINSIFIFALNNKVIEDALYHKTIELLINLVADGLIVKE